MVPKLPRASTSHILDTATILAKQVRKVHAGELQRSQVLPFDEHFPFVTELSRVRIIRAIHTYQRAKLTGGGAGIRGLVGVGPTTVSLGRPITCIW